MQASVLVFETLQFSSGAYFRGEDNKSRSEVRFYMARSKSTLVPAQTLLPLCKLDLIFS